MYVFSANFLTISVARLETPWRDSGTCLGSEGESQFCEQINSRREKWPGESQNGFFLATQPNHQVAGIRVNPRRPARGNKNARLHTQSGIGIGGAGGN